MPIQMRVITGCLLLALVTGCNERSRLAMKAELGGREAKREYGLWLWRKGHDRDTPEAIVWLTKAAESGDLEAIFELGLYYEVGGGPKPKAVNWFRKGAEAGDPNCMGKLAEAYRYGYLGLEKDEKQYRYWMDKAMAIDRERSKKYGR